MYGRAYGAFAFTIHYRGFPREYEKRVRDDNEIHFLPRSVFYFYYKPNIGE